MVEVLLSDRDCVSLSDPDMFFFFFVVGKK